MEDHEGDTWKPCVTPLSGDQLGGRKGNQFGGGGEQNIKEKEKREKKEKENKGKEWEEKGRRTDCSPSIFRHSVNQGVGIVHAPRGRGFLLF